MSVLEDFNAGILHQDRVRSFKSGVKSVFVNKVSKIMGISGIAIMSSTQPTHSQEINFMTGCSEIIDIDGKTSISCEEDLRKRAPFETFGFYYDPAEFADTELDNKPALVNYLNDPSFQQRILPVFQDIYKTSGLIVGGDALVDFIDLDKAKNSNNFIDWTVHAANIEGWYVAVPSMYDVLKKHGYYPPEITPSSDT